MKNLDPQRARWIKLRMGGVCGLMGIACGMLVSSAYRLQIEDGAEWRDLAEAQRQRRMHVAPKRGTLYDRNGVALAVSVEVPSVSADAFEMLRGVDEKLLPARVKEIAAHLARALSLDPNEVATRIAQKRRFTWLKRRVTADEAAAVKALGDPKKTANPIRGLSIEGEGRRYYPNRELAGPMMGFVAPDGEGKEGLELALEDELRGHVEEVKGLRDRSGRLLFAEGVPNEKALAGHGVFLSIDQGIQYVAEQELDAAVRTYEAVGGSIVVVEPSSGEILALASAPGYNPNDYQESAVDARRNRAVHDRFEPGSTIKVFTLAAALSAHTLSPTQRVYCEKGSMAIDNVVIHDTHVSEWLNPTQILAVSSNIGAAKIGIELGESRLYEAFRRFGFGEATGLPLSGEATGVLRSRGRPWVQVETAAASFGQGVSTTSVQLAMAIGAIANGGKLMEPILVKRVVDGVGNVVREATPKVRREAIPANVAKTMAEMLVAVTEGEGTGIEAALTGFKVAGKTATAQKADPETGRYTQDRFTSSFIGFVPADRPRLAILVVLDEPMLTHAGGAVAAPAFRRVAEFSLRYLGVKPEGTKEATLSAVAAQAAGSSSAKPTSSGVPWKTSAPKIAYVPLADMPVPNSPSGTAVVPTVLGLPAREALRTAMHHGLSPSLHGFGIVARQEPPPGQVVPRGTVVKLFFEPPTLRMSALSLSALAGLVPGARVRGDGEVRPSGLFQDSRKVEAGSIFAVRSGERTDGRAFADGALSRGAVAVLTDDAAFAESVRAPSLLVPDVRMAIGPLARAVYGDPFAKLEVVGVTGTNGKTTTTYLVRGMLAALGCRAAVLGTLGCTFEELVLPGTHTTPEADDLARTARTLVDRGATHLAMEVSSHALSLGRVEGVPFRVASFGNLSHDHLDFHGSFAAYGEAKARLFTDFSPAASVVNVDDPFGKGLAERAKGRVLRVSPSGREDADVRAVTSSSTWDGIRAELSVLGASRALASPLVGAHNLENLGVAIGIAAALGLDVVKAIAALGAVSGVPGRLERCSAAGDPVLVLVDYAHTPDALARVLATVRPLTRGKIVCVFGCGGDRDPHKRPRMGEAAARGADRVIVTNDNPRTEDPAEIAASAAAGVTAAGGVCDVVLDRREAIERAVRLAQPGDTVLIAGKGHEPYQIVGTEVRAFDDRDEARRAIALAKGAR